MILSMVDVISLLLILPPFIIENTLICLLFSYFKGVLFSHCSFPLVHAGGLNIEGESDSYDFGVGKE